MGIYIETKSKVETQKAARILAQSILESNVRGPLILALEGELGSGKTAFAQGFAKGLGVRERALSPTFVLMKTYPILSKFLVSLKRERSGLASLTLWRSGQVPSSKFQKMVHIDCYRIEKPQDLVRLDFRGTMKNPHAIILIEWADRVKKLIPVSALWIRFEHGRKPNERLLIFGSGMKKTKKGSGAPFLNPKP